MVIIIGVLCFAGTVFGNSLTATPAPPPTTTEATWTLTINAAATEAPPNQTPSITNIKVSLNGGDYIDWADLATDKPATFTGTYVWDLGPITGQPVTIQFRAQMNNKQVFSDLLVTTRVAGYTFNGWRPPVMLAKNFKSGSTVPVKFMVIDGNGDPVAEGLEVTVTIGTSSRVAVIDNPVTGQWKAEVVLSGSGTQEVAITGNIQGVTPLSIYVKP